MALPQGIRERGSRPRGCSGIDGSEHLHRVNRIHLAPRARTQWSHIRRLVKLNLGFFTSEKDSWKWTEPWTAQHLSMFA